MTTDALQVIGNVAAFGNVLVRDLKEKNDWKKRILSTIPGIIFPDNWDTLDESEKERRLDEVIQLTKITEQP